MTAFTHSRGVVLHRGRGLSPQEAREIEDIFTFEAKSAVKADDWQGEQWARGLLRELMAAQIEAAAWLQAFNNNQDQRAA